MKYFSHDKKALFEKVLENYNQDHLQQQYSQVLLKVKLKYNQLI